MAMIAYKCPEIQVVVVDINQVRTTFAASAKRPPMSCSPVFTVLRELPLPSNLAPVVPRIPASQGSCSSTCWTSLLWQMCEGFLAWGATWSAVQQGAV